MMRQIFEKELNELELVRKEEENGYEYFLYKIDEYNYATVHKYCGYYIKMIGNIDRKLVMNLTRRDFIDEHAVIHIMPRKYIKIWRNEEFRKGGKNV